VAAGTISWEAQRQQPHAKAQRSAKAAEKSFLQLLIFFALFALLCAFA
jgi:hypothetical protein